MPKLRIMLFAVIMILIVLIVYLFLRQPSFGKLPAGKRLERIQHSPHFKEGSFQNLSDTPMIAGSGNMLKVVKEIYFKKHSDIKPRHTLPFVKKPFPVIPEISPVITWFGHSSYLLQYIDTNILVDPVFSERASPVSYIGSKAFTGSNAFSIDDLPAIDIVLITHDHYDHLDYHVIRKLRNRVPVFIVPLGVGAHLEYWGVDPKKIREMDWWQELNLSPGLHLIATPARHFSGRSFKRNKTLWTSYVLFIGYYKLFLGGDSGYDTHFSEIGTKYGPFHLAILESGQYNKMWPNIHMFPEETIQAAIDLHAKALLPVHWAKFALSVHPWYEPAERAAVRAGEVNLPLITPLIGERIVLKTPGVCNHWWNHLKPHSGINASYKISTG